MGPSTMYHCGACDTTIFSKDVYNAHFEGRTRAFRCPMCPKVFTSPCSFELHSKRMHDGQAGIKITHWTPEDGQQRTVPSAGQSHLSIRASRPPPRGRRTPPGVFTRRVKSSALTSVASNPPLSSMVENNFVTAVPLSPPQSGVIEGDLIDFSDNSGDENAENEIAAVEEEEDNFEKFMKAAAAFQARVSSQQRSDLIDDTGIRPQAQSPASSKICSVPPQSTPQVELSKPAPENASKASPPQPSILCTECNVPFSSHAALLMHQTSTEHNYCRICDAFFSDSKNRQQHYRRIHNLSCVKCARIFVSLTTLTDHQRESKHGYCVECDCYFFKESSHESHLANVHDIDITSHASSPRAESKLDGSTQSFGSGYCTQCDADLEKGDTMADHSAKNHPYRCSQTDCSFAAPKYAHLVNHQREEKHNFCDICDRLFDSKEALDEHRNSDEMHKNASETGGEDIPSENISVGHPDGNSDSSDLEEK